MCDPVTATIVTGAVIGASVYQGEQTRKEGKKARAQATANAEATAKQQERDFNRANKKAPNVAGFTAANTNAAKAGIGSTMLTGVGGIQDKALSLSKNTLLGG